MPYARGCVEFLIMWTEMDQSSQNKQRTSEDSQTMKNNEFDELEEARREALRLALCIYKTEYQESAPDWKPSETVGGIISQIDNMYAGVREQRDKKSFVVLGAFNEIESLRSQLSAAKEAGKTDRAELSRIRGLSEKLWADFREGRIPEDDGTRIIGDIRHTLLSKDVEIASKTAEVERLREDAQKWRDQEAKKKAENDAREARYQADKRAGIRRCGDCDAPVGQCECN